MKINLNSGCDAQEVKLTIDNLTNDVDTINIESDYFTTRELNKLISFLGNSANQVNNLSLLSNNIGDSDVEKLCNSLQKNNKIQSFEIGGNISDVGMDAITKMINVSKIDALRIANAEIGSDQMANLTQALSNPANKVTKLNFSENEFRDDEALDNLINFLQQPSCKVKTFAFSEEGIGDSQISKLADLTYSNISELHIGGWKSAKDDSNENEGLQILANSLKSTESKIDSFHLHNCEIGDSDLSILADMVKNSNLKKFAILDSSIGDFGILSGALQNRKCKLTDLSLKGCHVGNSAAQELIKALRSPTTDLQRILLDNSVSQDLRDEIDQESEKKQKLLKTRKPESKNNNSISLLETASKLDNEEYVSYIEINKNNYNPNDFEVLFNSLHQENYVHNLIVVGNLQKSETDKIINFLESDFCKIKQLDLYLYSSDVDTNRLIDSLKKNNGISSLQLYYDDLSDENVKQIKEINFPLKTLVIKSSNITDDGVAILSEMMAENKSLTNTGILVPQIGDKGLKSLTEVIQQGCATTHLELGGDSEANSSLEEFFSALSDEKCNITNLNLHEFVAKNTLENLSKTVAKGCKINFLKTGHSNKEDFHFLGEALRHDNNQITSLQTTYSLDSDQIENLGSSINVLESLDIRESNINDRELIDLSNILSNGKNNLSQLNIFSNNITDIGVESFTRTLRGKSNLTNLYLNKNKITDIGAIDLLEFLDYNTSLRSIGLNRNDITERLLNLVNEKSWSDRPNTLSDEERKNNENFYNILREEARGRIFTTSAEEAFSDRESQFIIMAAIKFRNLGRDIVITDKDIKRLSELSKEDPILKKALTSIAEPENASNLSLEKKLKELEETVNNNKENLDSPDSEAQNIFEKMHEELQRLRGEVENLKSENSKMRETAFKMVECVITNKEEDLQLLKDDLLNKQKQIDQITKSVESIREDVKGSQEVIEMFEECKQNLDNLEGHLDLQAKHGHGFSQRDLREINFINSNEYLKEYYDESKTVFNELFFNTILSSYSKAKMDDGKVTKGMNIVHEAAQASSLPVISIVTSLLKFGASHAAEKQREKRDENTTDVIGKESIFNATTFAEKIARSFTIALCAKYEYSEHKTNFNGIETNINKEKGNQHSVLACAKIRDGDFADNANISKNVNEAHNEIIKKIIKEVLAFEMSDTARTCIIALSNQRGSPQQILEDLIPPTFSNIANNFNNKKVLPSIKSGEEKQGNDYLSPSNSPLLPVISSVKTKPTTTIVK